MIVRVTACRGIAVVAVAPAIPVAMTAVAVAITANRVINAAGNIGQRPKIIVEGMVLLHHHDYVLDVLQRPLAAVVVIVRPGRMRRGQREQRYTGSQSCATGHPIHDRPRLVEVRAHRARYEVSWPYVMTPRRIDDGWAISTARGLAAGAESGAGGN